jgi:hypothetical protein
MLEPVKNPLESAMRHGRLARAFQFNLFGVDLHGQDARATN